MRTAVFDRFGPPEVLRVVDLPDPEPGPGQVRVRVLVSGVQPFDAAVRSGTMSVPVTFPQQIGNEFTGVIDRVGSKVSGRVPGDDVLGWAPLRSHAELVVADADAVVARPAGMDRCTAGAIGASGQTALTALRELRIAPGETLLVHAAAGGAGSAAVQIARARGVRVIGTARPDHHDRLAAWGAVPVAYGAGLVDRVRVLAPDGVDAVLDAVGGTALVDSVELVHDRTRIGTLVDHAVADRLGVRGIRATRSVEQLHELVELHREGRLEVAVRAVHTLEDIVGAHRGIERGHGVGKIVLTAPAPTAPDTGGQAGRTATS